MVYFVARVACCVMSVLANYPSIYLCLELRFNIFWKKQPTHTAAHPRYSDFYIVIFLQSMIVPHGRELYGKVMKLENMDMVWNVLERFWIRYGPIWYQRAKGYNNTGCSGNASKLNEVLKLASRMLIWKNAREVCVEFVAFPLMHPMIYCRLKWCGLWRLFTSTMRISPHLELHLSNHLLSDQAGWLRFSELSTLMQSVRVMQMTDHTHSRHTTTSHSVKNDIELSF